MTGAMLDKILKMCRANYPDYNIDYKSKGVLWMQEFIKQPDDLMETAMWSCIKFCKKFPAIADINEAIRDLHYDSSTKPKQLAWEVPRTNSLQQKISDMVNGKTDTKQYLQSLNISKQIEYARTFFQDISAELVLRNLPEFMQGMEQEELCWHCKIQKQACNGYKVKHWLNKDGWVSNQYVKCEKIERR